MTAKLSDLLKRSDEELFTGGGCHVYAMELKKRYPGAKIKHAGNPDSIGPTRAMHVYAVLGELKIDVCGPTSETQYLASNQYTSWEVSIDELTKVDPTQLSNDGPLNRWRHNLDVEFISRASERARCNIEGHFRDWKLIV